MVGSSPIRGVESSLKVFRKQKDSWSREEVEKLCIKAYQEGSAYTIASHKDFKQIHLTIDEWIKENL